jgi:hypothetical protein
MEQVVISKNDFNDKYYTVIYDSLYYERMYKTINDEIIIKLNILK